MKELGRGSIRTYPCFSESKDMNIMSVSQVSNSSIMKRMCERPDVEGTQLHMLRKETYETGPGLD